MSLRPVFVLVGDSLTEWGSCVASRGWASLLQEEYVRSVDVLNRGLAGYTSKDTVQLVLPMLQREWQERRLDPQLITLWLGANDAALPTGHSASKHVPLDDYAAHVRTILQFLVEQAPHANVIVLTPPPVDDPKRMELSFKPGFLDRSVAHTRKYAQTNLQVVRQFQAEHPQYSQRVEVIDLFEEMNHLSEVELPKCFIDGLHLSSKGNELVWEAIRRVIRAKWPQLASESQRWQLPDHKTIH